MKLLDLSKFEKVSEDKHTTKMRHKDGHEMTIMVAALPKIHREQLKRLKMAKGGEASNDDLDVEPVDPKDPANQADPSSPDHSTTINIATPSAQTPPAGAASIQGAANLNPLQQQAQGILGAQNQQALGASQQAQVDSAKAQAMVPVEQAQIQAEAQRKLQTQANANMVQGATKDYADWMAENGTVNPQHFAQSQSDARKVGNAVALIIGGFGAGFSGTGNNPAMNYLMAQQDKDIAAQQSNIANHKTVLGAYQSLFNDKNAAIEATRISDNNKLAQQAAKIAAQQGTAQAWANYNAFVGKLNMDNDAHTQNAAGYLTTNPPQGAAPAQAQPASATQSNQASQYTSGILSPDAEKKYQQVLYDPTKTPQQKAEIQDEYLNGVQVDKSLQQIDQLYPEIAAKRNFGGYLANKIDPKVAGGLGIGAAEALTGGGAGIGFIPAGLAGAAAGTAAGAGLKQGLTAMGGQTEQQYQTAKGSLEGYIGNALQGVKITPTDIGELADKFTPTYFDSPETIKDKQEKLKEKIKTLTKTGALKANGMTND
jgi:hypothetical protein